MHRLMRLANAKLMAITQVLNELILVSHKHGTNHLHQECIKSDQ